MTSLVRSKRLESSGGKVTKRGKCAIGGYHDGRPVNLFFRASPFYHPMYFDRLLRSSYFPTSGLGRDRPPV